MIEFQPMLPFDAPRRPPCPLPLLPPPRPNDLVEDEQARILRMIPTGTTCRCCGQFAKVYRRRFNSAMAVLFQAFWKQHQIFPGWIHVRSLSGIRGARDAGFLEAWGLLESASQVNKAEKPRSGMLRITEKGEAFARLQVDVPEFLYFYNAGVLGESRETLSLSTALESTGYNHAETMTTS